MSIMVGLVPACEGKLAGYLGIPNNKSPCPQILLNPEPDSFHTPEKAVYPPSTGMTAPVTKPA